MPGWEWIHTPGHTEGHVSLFRERDRVVLAGDAFITVQQESAWSVITQTKNVQGPPAYFTPDWERAEQSVRKLADLQPEIAYTGHGRPLYGEELRFSLQTLVDQFDQLAVPDNGKYVHGR